MTPPNPFVGLRPYESSDSLFYFGRTAQTKTLLRQLHQHRFVAVVGSSGSGKSSLIRAGLIPQLEAGFLVQDRDQWRVAKLKPGETPLARLAEVLLGSAGAVENLVTAIQEQGTQAITDLLEPQLANSDTNLFILVDQFEELFRFGLGKGKTKQRQEAEDFVALLLSLTRHELPIYVCLTMRSDFLGDCDAFYGLPEAINQSQFLVPRLTRQQRQEVITHPVHLAGAKIAPRLVDRLLNEGIDTRDDLPVLQHVLMRTWNVWRESCANESSLPLDIEHYEKTGTIHYALNSHADEALNELDERQQHIAKKLFQTLTTVDAGNRRIRRAIHLSTIATIAEATPEEVKTVLKCFRSGGREFLIASPSNMIGNPLIDISHESLIRQWVTLDKWAQEEQEIAEIYLRLIDFGNRYKNNQSELWTGADLVTAKKWFDTTKSSFSWAKLYGSESDLECALWFYGESKAKNTKDKAYAGTIKVNIRDKDHYVHTSVPPAGAKLEDLERALQHNRDVIDDCQARMNEAFVDQVYKFKPPMMVNYDSPTQDAIVAHLNINILIPLINIRSGSASFSKAETFHVKQRVEIMRSIAERMAHMENDPEKHEEESNIPNSTLNYKKPNSISSKFNISAANFNKIILTISGKLAIFRNSFTKNKKPNAPDFRSNYEETEVTPTAYTGTVIVNIRSRDHYLHISPPPMGATLDDLERALLHNRAMINDCQTRMKEAFIDQVYKFKPPMMVNYDSPTQDAIAAHLHINILIPLINIRGSNASFTKPETFHVKQRVEIMRNVAERMVHIERDSKHSPMPTALVATVVFSTVIFALFTNGSPNWQDIIRFFQSLLSP